jgi:hypothetical protein
MLTLVPDSIIWQVIQATVSDIIVAGSGGHFQEQARKAAGGKCREPIKGR